MDSKRPSEEDSDLNESDEDMGVAPAVAEVGVPPTARLSLATPR